MAWHGNGMGRGENVPKIAHNQVNLYTFPAAKWPASSDYSSQIVVSGD